MTSDAVPLRILIVSGERRVREAGASGVVFQHAEGLQKLGHQVEVWFQDDVLPKPRWPARFQALEFARALARKIRQNAAQFDVVNIHAPWGCVYGLARKWSSKALAPYVFTMQGCEQRYVTTMRLEDAKGRATNFAWKNRVWHRLFHQTMYDFSISTADFGAVANREGWIFSELNYGHAPGRIWYLPNGVTPEFFLPRIHGDSAATRLLFVGTWLDRKGIYYLADAFTALATRRPELRLTVAGCVVSEPQVKAYFPREFQARIEVMPFISREAMPGLYAAHDIFVFPSLMEGMPLSLLEAMAAGMPIVTTNTCGMADLIENERNGLLVTAADAAELEMAIDRLCTSAELREKLGLAAQDTARQYTWDKIALQFERILRLAARFGPQSR